MPARRRQRRVGAVSVIFPTDVKALQHSIINDVSALDAVVSPCLTKLDEATVSAWHDQKNVALKFAGESTGTLTNAAEQYSRGQLIQKDLQAWYPRLQAAGCGNVPAPQVTPKPSLSTENPGTLMASLGDLSRLIPWVVAFLVYREFKGR
jgi:hypothetical protein